MLFIDNDFANLLQAAFNSCDNVINNAYIHKHNMRHTHIQSKAKESERRSLALLSLVVLSIFFFDFCPQSARRLCHKRLIVERLRITVDM